jgi:outer membrane protein assembly factor BamB
MGQDPEHGEGPGRLWCIDPTRRGDVSSEILGDLEEVGELTREEIFRGETGARAVANPNSAVLWKYDKVGEEFHEKFGRTLASPVIADNLLIVPDLSGIVHCLDATTGKLHWTCDALAGIWGSALIVDDRVYVGTEDGTVLIFPLSADPQKTVKRERLANGKLGIHGEALTIEELHSSVYSTPTLSNNVLFIADRKSLYAIAK